MVFLDPGLSTPALPIPSLFLIHILGQNILNIPSLSISAVFREVPVFGVPAWSNMSRNGVDVTSACHHWRIGFVRPASPALRLHRIISTIPPFVHISLRPPQFDQALLPQTPANPPRCQSANPRKFCQALLRRIPRSPQFCQAPIPAFRCDMLPRDVPLVCFPTYHFPYPWHPG